jgi:hypothetical protein
VKQPAPEPDAKKKHPGSDFPKAIGEIWQFAKEKPQESILLKETQRRDQRS